MMKLGEREIQFSTRYQGDKSNKINQTPWRKTIGEKEQICFVYTTSMLLSIVQFICTIYTRYTRAFKVLLHMAWTRLDHSRTASLFFLDVPRVYDFRVLRDKLWEKVGKSEGIWLYVNNLHGIIRRTCFFFPCCFFSFCFVSRLRSI